MPRCLDVQQMLASFRAALQVFVTTTALSAELCWMSCKCSHHRTAPQVFVATTAPCAALCWMSCKCLHLFCFVHRKFSSQPRHPVPRCAGCLANARIFAQHRTFLSQESTPCRMCQNHSEPNVSEPLRTFTNKNASSLLECIINLLLSLLACCRVLK